MPEEKGFVVTKKEVGNDSVSAEKGAGVDGEGGKTAARSGAVFFQNDSPFYRVSWKDERVLAH